MATEQAVSPAPHNYASGVVRRQVLWKSQKWPLSLAGFDATAASKEPKKILIAGISLRIALNIASETGGWKPPCQNPPACLAAPTVAQTRKCGVLDCGMFSRRVSREEASP